MRSDLPEDWSWSTVGDLYVEGGLAGGPFGSSLGRKDYVKDGVPVIRGNNLSGPGRFNATDFVFVTEEKLERDLRRNTAIPGDLVITQRGTLGQVGVLPSGPYERYVVSQSQMRLRPDPSKASRDYVYYVFRSPWMVDQIERRAIATGVPHINLRILADLPIPLPPVAEQERIASVLRAIDDKIDSNAQLCSLLAAAISTVVRHRLVDAEPGSGWTPGVLTSIARFVNGRAFTKDANGAGRPILRIRELNSGLSEATPYSDIDAEDDNIARHDDILFSWSGSLGLYRWHGPESLINQHIFKVLPLDPYPPWFVVEWVREHMPEFQRIARDKATTMGHIKREHLTQAVVNIPPPALIGEVDAEVAPLDAQIGALAAETATLRAIRDGLLPKLIFGEIRVSTTDDHVPFVSVAAEKVPA
jgi:type I restriction enzyme S subunit